MLRFRLILPMPNGIWRRGFMKNKFHKGRKHEREKGRSLFVGGGAEAEQEAEERGANIEECQGQARGNNAETRFPSELFPGGNKKGYSNMNRFQIALDQKPGDLMRKRHPRWAAAQIAEQKAGRGILRYSCGQPVRRGVFPRCDRDCDFACYFHPSRGSRRLMRPPLTL